MQPTVVHEPSASRWEARLDGEVAGFAEYTRDGTTLSFTHTVVEPRFEGHGVGSALLRAALRAAEEEGAQVLPYCSFVRGWLDGHPEHLGLVPADQRERFGLPPGD